MKFVIKNKRSYPQETLSAGLAIAMCVALFLVWGMTSLGTDAVPVSVDPGAAAHNWLMDTALYELLGFSEAEPLPPQDSVYTARPEGRTYL